jgi:ActD protein
MNETATNPRVYGLLAEFCTAEAIIDAARQTRTAGYRCIDALTPFPVHGLDDALALPPNRVPLIFFIGGIVGGLSGFLMQVFACVYNYPINVGGRPLYSWPAFIPITFELTILFAGLAGAFGMLALNGFPKPYHPLFNAPNFDLATQNRFFLLIQADDPQFHPLQTRAFLESLHPTDINEVPV